MRTGIYTPRGRALEYGKKACELYMFCGHGCRYCYVPGCTGVKESEWRKVNAVPLQNAIGALRKSAEKWAGSSERVLFSFFSDPYNPMEPRVGVMREALSIMRANDIPFQVLTKGGSRAVRDFYLYGPHDAFATTMVFITEAMVKKWEPGAASVEDRINAIRMAKRKGIETWVSLEPVIDVEESLEIIRITAPWVDLFKVGKLNHDPARECKIDWRRFGMDALSLLESLGKRYYFKDDMKKIMVGIPLENTDTRKVKR